MFKSCAGLVALSSLLLSGFNRSADILVRVIIAGWKTRAPFRSVSHQPAALCIVHEKCQRVAVSNDILFRQQLPIIVPH